MAQSDNLLEHLTNAWEQAKRERIGADGLDIRTALASGDMEARMAAALKLHEIAGELSTHVTSDHRFPGNDVRMLRTIGGTSAFYPFQIGVSILMQALRTDSPKNAIDWLQKVLNAPGANGTLIQTLWGAPVESEIELTAEVKIVPIEAIPESTQKQWITTVPSGSHDSHHLTIFDFSKPDSALLIKQRIEPLTCDPAVEPYPGPDRVENSQYLFEEISLALTVSGPRIPILASQWFTFDDVDIENARMGTQRTMTTPEILPNIFSIQNSSTPLNAVDAKKIVSEYFSLVGKTRSKVRLALQRLNQSLRRHNVGDSAVELSIAFEALLGDDGTTEMTHKIKVRSVRLLGGQNDVRLRNAAVVSHTYSIRSKLVHMGGFDPDKQYKVVGLSMTANEIIGAATTLCVALIRLIMAKGEIPDWSTFDYIEQTLDPI